MSNLAAGKRESGAAGFRVVAWVLTALSTSPTSSAQKISNSIPLFLRMVQSKDRVVRTLCAKRIFQCGCSISVIFFPTVWFQYCRNKSKVYYRFRYFAHIMGSCNTFLLLLWGFGWVQEHNLPLDHSRPNPHCGPKKLIVTWLAASNVKPTSPNPELLVPLCTVPRTESSC